MASHTLRRAAAAVTSGLLVGGILAGIAPSAQAENPGVDATFDCTIPVKGGSGPVTTRYRTNLPSTIYAGESEPMDVRIGTRGILPWTTMKDAWNIIGARSLRNKATMDISIGSQTNRIQLGGSLMVLQSGEDVQLDSETSWGSAAWVPPTTPTQVQVRMPAKFTSALNFYKNAAGTSGTTIGSSSSSTCSNAARPLIHTINVKARSTTTLQVAQPNPIEDDPVEVSAEVQVSAGTAAGAVEFSTGPDASAKKITVPVANGKASGLITGLPAGNYPVTARFVPTQPALYDASSSDEQAVNIAAPVPAQRTTTTMTLDRAAITSDEQATATVTVTAEEGTPVGNARITVNGQSVTEPVADGQATVRVPRLRSGSYSVSTTFLPAKPREFASSAASPASLTVTPGAGGDLADTSTWLELSSTRLVADKPSTLEARVTSTSDKPVNGSVEFAVGERRLSARVVNGRAVVAVPGLPVGTYQVGATFVPEVGAAFASSEATVREVTVVKAGTPDPGVAQPTTTTVTAPSRTVVGGRVALSAKVQVTGAAPAEGSVEFTIGAVKATAPVVNGVAHAEVRVSAAGQQTVRATFRPTGNQRASGDFASLTVDRAPSRTAVTAKAGKKKAKKKSVTVTVRTTGSASACATPVTITLTKGKVIRKVTKKATCQGVARVKVKLAGPKVKGNWTVRAVTAGTANTLPSAATAKVRVK